jgi:uncharacterized protein (TIGR02246 family)
MSDHQQDERAIRGLIAAWSRAVEAKDPDAITAAYTGETVLFDAIPPYRTVGAAAIRALWAECLPYFPERFRSEHADLSVDVDGDLALVTAMYRFVPEPAGHPCGDSWMRVTAALRRIDGHWRIVHEHVSRPFDPISSRAVAIRELGADPAAPGAADRAARQGLATVTPHLVCADAARAIDFYREALGATVTSRVDGPDGKVWNAGLAVNGGSVMLNDEMPAMGAVGPRSLGSTPVTVHLVTDDVDAAVARAVAAGATVVIPPADMFWGDRYALVEDPFGHRWAWATPIAALTAEEIQRAAAAFAAAQ